MCFKCCQRLEVAQNQHAAQQMLRGVLKEKSRGLFLAGAAHENFGGERFGGAHVGGAPAFVGAG